MEVTLSFHQTDTKSSKLLVMGMALAVILEDLATMLLRLLLQSLTHLMADPIRNVLDQPRVSQNESED